jgi:WD40 repeat protein
VGVGYSSGASDVLEASDGGLVVREASSASIAAGDLAIPPDDKSLVTVSLDGYFRTWATHGSEQLLVHAPPDPAVEFEAGGRDLVLVGERGEIVSRADGRVLRTFPGFPAGSVFNICNSACFSGSPQLRWLTYVDSRAATPRVVELAGQTGRRVGVVTVPRLDAQGVAPNGKIVAAYVDNGRLLASLIDPRTGHRRALQTGASSPGCAATQPAFTPDSRLMAIIDGCIDLDVWNLRTGRIVRTIVLADRSNGAGARLTPDGRYALVTTLGGAFVRARIATGASIEIPGAAAEGNVLAIAPNGRWYAIGRQDGTVDVYDARSLRLVRHHQLIDPIESLAFSPDGGSLAVEDTSDTVRVWDTCSVCENPVALAALARRQTVRSLTEGERQTFNVGSS